MSLQNRVDPFGDIHAVAARGLFTGNRGVIHDPATKTLLSRRWTTKAWIVCECEFGGRRREVMGRNAPSGKAGWTELFFLDEVTALAAGHRPCFFCRRESAKAFVECYADAFGVAAPRVAEIDARLHAERLASGTAVPGGPAMVEIGRDAFEALPDGAMLFQGDRAFAKKDGVLRAWTFRGWGDAWDFGELSPYDTWQITPPTTVAILRKGYRPVWHPSIGRLP
jgi:hypothetical protein